MKVVLVNPSAITGRRDVEGAWPPLGLLYLATLIERNGFSVSLLDNGPLGYPPRKVFEWIKREDPTVVGFHTLSMSSIFANQIAERIKKEMPEVKILYGGFHATINHRRILTQRPFVDVAVRGEGEITIIEVIDALEKDHSLRKIRGISYKENGRIRINPSRPPIENLDEIPFPNRDFLNCDYHGTINGIKTAIRNFTSIITSRGCPYSCSFCCESIREFKKWRSRSPENIVEELAYLESRGYGQTYFVDDSFTVDSKRIFKLCELMRKEKLDIIWAAETRVSHASRELLQEMERVGCVALFFGIESAVPRILRYYRKGTTPKMSEDAVSNCHEVGMDAYGGFILGAPGETLSEMWTTIRFADKIGIDFPNFYVLFAYPGTPIWNELVSNGSINEDECWETGVAVPEASPDCVSIDEVRGIIRKGYRYLLTNPRYLGQQILRLYQNPVRRAVLRNNFSPGNLRHLLNQLFSSEYY